MRPQRLPEKGDIEMSCRLRKTFTEQRNCTVCKEQCKLLEAELLKAGKTQEEIEEYKEHLRPLYEDE